MKLKLPLEFDNKISYANREEPYNFIMDAEGKIICDTMNSDLIEIHEEHDEDGGIYWDQGTKPLLEEIVNRVNLHDSLIELLRESALNLYCTCDASGKCLKCRILIVANTRL